MGTVNGRKGAATVESLHQALLLDQFFVGRPAARALYGQLLLLLAPLGPVEQRPRRTQIGLAHGVLFSCVWHPPRKADQNGLMLQFTLEAPLAHPRVLACTQPYPGRFTHHLLLSGPQALDAELLSWLNQAYDYAGRRFVLRN